MQIDRILSWANFNAQDGFFLAKDDFVHNIEDNINMQDVRQWNFRILIDKQGMSEPLSFNKTHTYTILSPPPCGEDYVIPNVLHNAVSAETVKLPVPEAVLNYIGLPPEMSESELGCFKGGGGGGGGGRGEERKERYLLRDILSLSVCVGVGGGDGYTKRYFILISKHSLNESLITLL